MGMIQTLLDRADFVAACNKAKAQSIADEGCGVYVAYVARGDYFKVSNWTDDASVCVYINGERDYL